MVVSDNAVAILAIVFTSVTTLTVAVVAARLAARATADQGLRTERLEAYPLLWAKLKLVSTWPRTPATFGQLGELHSDLRRWYYDVGGIYLSEWARARYGDAQQMIAAALATHQGDPAELLPTGLYDDVMVTSSWLRTGLTEDLQTRRRRSVRDSWRRTAFHSEAHQEAARRIGAPGTAAGRTAASRAVPQPRSLPSRYLRARRRARRDRRAVLDS